MPQSAASAEVSEMMIAPNSIDEWRPSGKMAGDGGDFTMACTYHEANGKFRLKTLEPKL
jgi:hypothetical protein